jgi:hypothetical protein
MKSNKKSHHDDQNNSQNATQKILVFDIYCIITITVDALYQQIVFCDKQAS